MTPLHQRMLDELSTGHNSWLRVRAQDCGPHTHATWQVHPAFAR